MFGTGNAKSADELFVVFAGTSMPAGGCGRSRLGRHGGEAAQIHEKWE